MTAPLRPEAPDPVFASCHTVEDADPAFERLMGRIEPFGDEHHDALERHRRALVRVAGGDEDPDTAGDAALLASVILDNEHWTSKGISTSDLAIVFEMSEQCGWGASYSPKRFREATADLRGVSKIGERWFPASPARVERLRTAGARVCTYCGADIGGKQASALYCDHCAGRAKRRRARQRRLEAA